VIDLHCHLLPGIDDGPADESGSVLLARFLADSGVATVAATPHLRADHPGVVPGELAARCARLRDRLAAERVPLQVVSGGELDLDWALGASPEALRDASFGGRGTDLLVETPYGPLPGSFEELLLQLSGAGYRLLLAHPERNPSFRERPSRLARLVGRGALVQLTASSLVAPPRRSRSGRFARWALEEGLAHVIASDSHALEADRAALAEGVEEARALVGTRADWMVEGAPAAILAGEPLPPAPQAREPRRGALGRLRRRRL
jgi:protein-tyrosine phosphatase